MVKFTPSGAVHMNFAVTGGAGFIGSHLVRRLVSDGHHVTIIDDFSRGSLANLDGIHEKIHIEKMDICDRDALDGVLQGADGIFHQAALGSVPESWKSPDTYQRVNVGGTENVFRIASSYHIKVVYASSASVYGDTQRIPITEDFERRPINPYGKTKLDCETLAERYMEKGSQIVGLRYFNVFGEGQNPAYAGVITCFLNRLNAGEPPIIFGDGSQIRDFTFVGDVVEANLTAMTGSVMGGFFNIGGGKSTSLTDLAGMMTRLADMHVKPLYENPRPRDAKISTADISKSAKLLGWSPRTSLEDGLRTLFQGSASKSS